jgi:hypothetical protein
MIHSLLTLALPAVLCSPVSSHDSPQARARSDSLAPVYQSGKTWNAFFASVDRRRELWEHNASVARIPDDLAARARKTGPWRILVITEPGCSDSANSVPYIAKLVETTPGFELRLVSSTVGRPWMEAHRSADGRAATPTILVLDADYELRGCWVEQPKKLQTFWLPVVAAGTQAEHVGEKLAWYASDAGRETLTEFVAVLEAAQRGEIICPGA